MTTATKSTLVTEKLWPWRRWLRKWVFLPMLFLTGCALAQCTYEWNYKLVLTVDTPSGIRKGSTVFGVTASPYIGLRRNGYALPAVGEALALDLAPSGSQTPQWVFVTINRNHTSGTLVAAVYSKELREMGAKSVHINTVAHYDWVR